MRKQKGITIVSLVVTIIVLIILAGVSINLILGENGIITIAKEAKENMELAQVEEQTKLNELYAQMTDESDGSLSYDAIAKLQEFKKVIAEAITDEGVETSETDTAEKMAENIKKLGRTVKLAATTPGITTKYLQTIKINEAESFTVSSDCLLTFNKATTCQFILITESANAVGIGILYHNGTSVLTAEKYDITTITLELAEGDTVQPVNSVLSASTALIVLE